MPLPISTNALLEKNKLYSDGVWLTLLEVVFPDNVPIRVCSNNENVSWNNRTWYPAIFSFSGSTETKDAEIPSITLTVQDIYRIITPFLDDYSGGLGAVINRYILNSKYLTDFTLGTERFINGDCESFLPTLNGVGFNTVRCTLARSSNFKYAGNQSAKMTKTDIYENSRYHLINGELCGLISGETYQITVWIYIPSGQTIQSVSLRYKTSEGITLTLDETSIKDSWTQLRGVYVEDGTLNPVIIREQGGTVIGESFYADAFSMKKGTVSGTYELKETMDILNCSVNNTNLINFQLGSENLINRRCPEHRYIKNHCRFHFKDSWCGYSGAGTSCNRSLENCRTLGNSSRFGGFPGIGQSGVYLYA